jgi:hypothetical protein
MNGLSSTSPASSSAGSDLFDHIRHNIFALFRIYEALYIYGVWFCNLILPRLDLQRLEQRKWVQVRKILRQMPVLRELKAAVYIDTFTPEGCSSRR